MFKKAYISTTEYRIWEVSNGRYVDEAHYVPYLEWVETNEPEAISHDRFINIVDGTPVEDPNKAATLADEAEQAALRATQTPEARITALENALMELMLE